MMNRAVGTDQQGFPSLSPRLVVYGHAGFDVSVVSGRSLKSVGGAAYYATLAASVIQPSVGVVTVLGKDFPIMSLQALQVDMSGVSVREGSSAVFCQEYDRAHRVANFGVDLNVCQELSPLLIPKHYIGASVFFVTTAPPEQQAKVLSWLKRIEYGGTIAIDTTLAYIKEFEKLVREYEGAVRLVFVNDDEYKALCWLPQAAAVIVKRGEYGASLYDGEVWTHVAAPVVERVCSTTGAGDILAGACLAALTVKGDLRGALVEGVALAAKSVTADGVEHLLR